MVATPISSPIAKSRVRSCELSVSAPMSLRRSVSPLTA